MNTNEFSWCTQVHIIILVFIMDFSGLGRKSAVVLSQIITKELKSECICYFKRTFPGMNFQFPAKQTKE